MITLLQISINLFPFSNPHQSYSCRKKQINRGFMMLQPTNLFPLSRLRSDSLHQTVFKSNITEPRIPSKSGSSDSMWSLARGKKREVVVRFNNQGFRFDDGEGNGDESGNVKLLGNLALGSGFIYLLATDRLGWVWDAIVSIWLLAVVLPIAGVLAFLWWAGKDIVISSCPNCGNDIEMYKTYLKDELQFCPYCTQPFSVVGDELISDPVKFSDNHRPGGQAFDRLSKNGKDFSSSVVDVEAEIVDAD